MNPIVFVVTLAVLFFASFAGCLGEHEGDVCLPERKLDLNIGIRPTDDGLLVRLFCETERDPVSVERYVFRFGLPPADRGGDLPRVDNLSISPVTDDLDAAWNGSVVYAFEHRRDGWSATTGESAEGGSWRLAFREWADLPDNKTAPRILIHYDPDDGYHPFPRGMYFVHVALRNDREHEDCSSYWLGEREDDPRPLGKPGCRF